MDEEKLNQARNYFNEIEQQITLLPKAQQELIFKKCAVNCVNNGVLPFLRERYEKCGGNMDLFFSNSEDSEYSFQKVVEKGHVYEMGYPKCFCYMYDIGFAKSKIHCECSRQSILYVLHKLFSQKKITVEIIHTVLGGFNKCIFRITVI